MQEAFELNKSEDLNGSIRNVTSNIQFEISSSAHDQTTAQENENFLLSLGTENMDFDDFYAAYESTESLNEINNMTVLYSHDRDFQEVVQCSEAVNATMNSFADSTSSYLNPETESNVTVSSVNTVGYAMCSVTGNILCSTDVSNEDCGKKSGPLTCLECPATFTSENHLEKHSNTHTNQKEFAVYNTFPSKSGVYSYIPDVGEQSNLSECKVNTPENRSTQVSASFVSLNSVDQVQILQKYSQQEMFECNVCQTTFAQKSHLTEHKRIHTEEKPFECNVCQKTFARKSHLTNHKRIHTGEQPFQCDVCQKKFSQKSHLTEHKRIHTGEQPFQCDVCQKKFSQKIHLTSHKRIHTGEQPFQCDVCQKQFAKKCNLIDHKRIHTGEKPF